MKTRIEFAQPSDLQEIRALLNKCGLPEAGLACRPGTLILAAKDEDRLVGCAALELFAEHALMRSVAVSADWRGRGLGDRLVGEALDFACRLRIEDIYLLTDDAERFFARHGFGPVDRSRVPAAVAGSAEFTSCRCAGATCMVKHTEARRERRSPSAPAISLRDLAPAWTEPAGCCCG